MPSFTIPATVGSGLARIAARLPAKTAVVEGDARIEFAQLDASATTIAEAIVASSDKCLARIGRNENPAALV